MKHHMRKRDTTKRCFICTELGHLAKNCMNIGRIEDEKKAKDDNIIIQIRQQWVQKCPENANQELDDTKVNELGGTIISN